MEFLGEGGDGVIRPMLPLIRFIQVLALVHVLNQLINFHFLLLDLAINFDDLAPEVLQFLFEPLVLCVELHILLLQHILHHLLLRLLLLLLEDDVFGFIQLAMPLLQDLNVAGIHGLDLVGDLLGD